MQQRNLSEHQVDLNDLNYVEQRYGLVLESMPCPVEKLTGKINPHVSRFKVLGMHNSVISLFHVKPVYYETSQGAWRPLYEVAEHYGNRNIVLKYEEMEAVHPAYMRWLLRRQELLNGQLLITSPYAPQEAHILTDKLGVKGAAQISFTTTTTYPDPDLETTTVDGQVNSSTTAGSWQARRDDTNGSVAVDNGTGYPAVYTRTSGSNVNLIVRGYALFDTSSIPDTDTIDNATLSQYFTSISDAHGLFSSVVEVSTASNTAIATTDYNIANFTLTKLTTDIDITSLSSGAYTDRALNASGLAMVNKTGVTSFGFLSAAEVDNSAPTLDSSATCNATMAAAEASGTTTDPKFAVVHSGGTTISPTAQSLAFTIPAYAVTGAALVSVTSQVLTTSLPAETVTANWSVSPNTQVATFTIPAYTIIAAGVTIMPDAQQLTFSLPAAAVLGYATVSPDAQTLTFSLPVSTVTADWKVSVNPVVLTVTLPTLQFVGALWGRTPRTTTGADWTRSVKNNDA